MPGHFNIKTAERYVHVRKDQLINIVSPLNDLWLKGDITITKGYIAGIENQLFNFFRSWHMGVNLCVVYYFDKKLSKNFYPFCINKSNETKAFLA